MNLKGFHGGVEEVVLRGVALDRLAVGQWHLPKLMNETAIKLNSKGFALPAECTNNSKQSAVASADDEMAIEVNVTNFSLPAECTNRPEQLPLRTSLQHLCACTHLAGSVHLILGQDSPGNKLNLEFSAALPSTAYFPERAPPAKGE